MSKWESELNNLHEALERLQVERFRLIGLLEEHLSPDLVAELLDGSRPQTLGGQRERVAVLFCDLRGFTRFTAAEPVDVVVAHLNQFFHAMTSTLFEHKATVDKFIGDAVLAFFRKKDEGEAAMAHRAVDCAITMRNRFEELSDGWHAGKALGLGMALSLGEVILGQVGSGRHVDYTIIGTPVNLASRLCALAGPGEILLTESLMEILGHPAEWEPLPPQGLKGFEEPVRPYLNRRSP